jgi:tRNA(adenine34) deaminase
MPNLDKHYMAEALKEAKKAFDADEVPIGAVIVHNGMIIGRAHNQIKMLKDPTAHAEMIAITQAATHLQSERLLDVTLYATLEPCPMCAGAMVLGRVKRLVYGAEDPKAGASGSIIDITNNKKLNHHIDVKKGVLEQECGALLKEFFAGKRKRMLNRALLLIVVFVSMFAALAIAGGNNIEFRPVLSQGELGGKSFDAIRNSGEIIYVWRLSYLADSDVKNVEMFRSVNVSRQFFVGVASNDEGKNRLRHFGKKFGKRRLAVFAEGNFLSTIPAEPPVFLGDKVIVRWPGTESELRSFVFKINKKPQGIASLYIEEQGKYNDVAADAWAEVYGNMNKYCEAKNRQFIVGKEIVEEIRE